MAKHRTHGVEFKRQVSQECLAGETLHGLSNRHDISRQLIRVWVEKYQAGALDEDAAAADLLQTYEARIAALERLVGKQALELEFLKGALRPAPQPKSGSMSAITGPRKPGALRNGAPFLDLPEAFRRLQGLLLKRPGGDREMVEILALVLHHDEQAVLCAVEVALEAGVPTKTHILNLLHRLVDGKETAVALIDAPQALTLRQEPKANVARYDTLRGKDVRHAF